MAIWMMRAGSGGQYEQKFLQEERVYVTWDGLDVNLADLSNRAELIAAMSTRYPDAKPKALINHASQVWPFATEMRIGDLIILPLKSQPAIQVGEIKGDYQFEPDGPNPYYHWRQVEWVGEAVPRANFGKDLFTSDEFSPASARSRPLLTSKEQIKAQTLPEACRTAGLCAA